MIAKIDADANENVDANELRRLYPNMNEKSIELLHGVLDKNKDGKLDRNEIQEHLPTLEKVEEFLQQLVRSTIFLSFFPNNGTTFFFFLT